MRFQSFFLAGFEGSTGINRHGQWFDQVEATQHDRAWVGITEVELDEARTVPEQALIEGMADPQGGGARDAKRRGVEHRDDA